ncbi:MAG: hypothetical protein AAB630_02070 [Patescibacteria group bacterium]
MQLSNIRFKLTRAALCAAAFSVTFITGITVTADLYLPLKNWLKLMFSHHWIGKGVLAGVVFTVIAIIFSFMPTPIDELKARTLSRSAWKLTIISCIGALVIVMFFIYEAFLKH